MSNFLIAPDARFDLDEIWSYYAVDLQNLETADRIRDEIFEALRKLARTPGLGHFRSDLAREPLRFWSVRSYLVIYRAEKRPLEIVRVLHGARDVQAILGGEGIRPEPME
jgi:plasmid stabilization system protein ParE